MSTQQLVSEDLKKLFNLMTVPSREEKKDVGSWQQEIKKRLDISHYEERESSELAKRVATFDGAAIDKMQRGESGLGQVRLRMTVGERGRFSTLELASGGPPHWDVLASTDVHTLEAGFKEIGPGYRIPSKVRQVS